METQAVNLRLFKFVPAERIDILENEKIAFTPPDRFKDPFEFKMGITKKTAREQVRAIIKQAEGKIKFANPAYRKISPRQLRKERQNLIRYKNPTQKPEDSFHESLQIHNWKLGILCLCETNENNLMWYHYADGRKGFVIELDCKHEAVKRLGKPWPVQYVDKPPYFEDIEKNPEVFRYKPDYLKYEQEHRVPRHLTEFTPEKTKKDNRCIFGNFLAAE